MPNVRSDRPTETREFFVELLGFEVAMDMGWVVTVISPTNPSAQVTIIGNDDLAAPGISVEVDDVDAVHARAAEQGAEIAYPRVTRSGGSGGSCFASRAARSSTSCLIARTERPGWRIRSAMSFLVTVDRARQFSSGGTPVARTASAGSRYSVARQSFSSLNSHTFATRCANGSPLPLPRMCVDMTIATRPSGADNSCSTSTRHSSQVESMSLKYLRIPAKPR